jgi:hypothetical protein
VCRTHVSAAKQITFHRMLSRGTTAVFSRADGDPRRHITYRSHDGCIESCDVIWHPSGPGLVAPYRFCAWAPCCSASLLCSLLPVWPLSGIDPWIFSILNCYVSSEVLTGVGMKTAVPWSLVVWYKFTDVGEVLAVSIMRASAILNCLCWNVFGNILALRYMWNCHQFNTDVIIMKMPFLSGCCWINPHFT